MATRSVDETSNQVQLYFNYKRCGKEALQRQYFVEHLQSLCRLVVGQCAIHPSYINLPLDEEDARDVHRYSPLHRNVHKALLFLSLIEVWKQSKGKNQTVKACVPAECITRIVEEQRNVIFPVEPDYAPFVVREYHIQFVAKRLSYMYTKVIKEMYDLIEEVFPPLTNSIFVTVYQPHLS
jgi:hypothetical protein